MTKKDKLVFSGMYEIVSAHGWWITIRSDPKAPYTEFDVTVGFGDRKKSSRHVSGDWPMWPLGGRTHNLMRNAIKSCILEVSPWLTDRQILDIVLTQNFLYEVGHHVIKAKRLAEFHANQEDI